MESAGETTGSSVLLFFVLPASFTWQTSRAVPSLLFSPTPVPSLRAPLCNALRAPLLYPLSSTYFTSAFFLLPRVSFASSRRYARHFHLALNC